MASDCQTVYYVSQPISVSIDVGQSALNSEINGCCLLGERIGLGPSALFGLSIFLAGHCFLNRTPSVHLYTASSCGIRCLARLVHGFYGPHKWATGGK